MPFIVTRLERFLENWKIKIGFERPCALLLLKQQNEIVFRLTFIDIMRNVKAFKFQVHKGFLVVAKKGQS